MHDRHPLIPAASLVRRSGLACGLLLLATTAGCDNGGFALTPCEWGHDMAHDGHYELAVKTLSFCLALPFLKDSTRADALLTRAWSQSNLGRDGAAVADQESAFKLRKPTTYHEFINYATYLRRVRRVQDSLDAIVAAERIEAGAVSMMTQYHKGWSLLELGRHAEAVEAFTKGMPVQADYPFVYWRRGLAYEGLGDKQSAKEDFERCARLLSSKEAMEGAGPFLPVIQSKLREYGLSIPHTPE